MLIQLSFAYHKRFPLYLHYAYLSISVPGFDLTSCPNESHPRLLFCKGIAAGEHGKHRDKPYWRKNFNDPPKSKIAVS